MGYENWEMLKTEIVIKEKEEEYSNVASWCNNNRYHIIDDGKYFRTVANPEPEPPTLEEQVIALERKYQMNRWQREGILAEGSLYSEYNKAKAQEIEDLAEELRKLTLGEK